jgi:hypothetical protein
MSTASFPRHTRRCRDAHVRGALAPLRPWSGLRDAFLHLLAVVHARSDIARVAPDRDHRLSYVGALLNLARYRREAVADPWAWPGATGHPLAVIHSLAEHLFADYPVPRFLASAWFGTSTIAERMRRNWFVQHGRGRAFRSLSLPMAMTRRMEHVFLRSPDHLGVDEALARAEVLGSGGEPELWDALRATALVATFTARRREIVAWLVRWQEELDLARVRPLVEHALADPRPLVGRTVEAVWCDHLARIAPRPPPPRPRPPPPPPPPPPERWAASRWSGLAVAGAEPGVTWTIVELCEWAQLRQEGIDMHHCVGGYAWRCHSGASSIWSLRHSVGDGPGVPVLTIEVAPARAAVVQVKGSRNCAPAGEPAAIVGAWAAREGLAVDSSVAAAVAVARAEQMAMPRAA